LSFDDLEHIWEGGGLFPNGSFFIQYVLQAAFLGNINDLWRGGDVLLEKMKKSHAFTGQELEKAEEVPPFRFGYKYQYFLLLFTVTLVYSSVVPLIIPCGLTYLVIKHYVDKYNLLYLYPKTPSSTNRLTKTVISLTLISMALYQVAMAIYFYFNKLAPGPALATVVAMLLSQSAGMYMNFVHFRVVKSHIHNHPALAEVDSARFQDAYLHPCFRRQREYNRARENAVPLVLSVDTEDSDVSLLETELEMKTYGSGSSQSSWE